LILQGFQGTLEIIREQECHDVFFELGRGVIVISFGRVAFDVSVEDLHLAVGPGMPELRQAVPDSVWGACLIEAVPLVFRA